MSNSDFHNMWWLYGLCKWGREPLNGADSREKLQATIDEGFYQRNGYTEFEIQFEEDHDAAAIAFSRRKKAAVE